MKPEDYLVITMTDEACRDCGCHFVMSDMLCTDCREERATAFFNEHFQTFGSVERTNAAFRLVCQQWVDAQPAKASA